MSPGATIVVRPPRSQPPASEAFERVFTMELLASEHRRVTLVAASLAIVLAILVVRSFLGRLGFEAYVGGGTGVSDLPAWPAVVYLGMIAYELIVRARFSYLLRQRRSVPEPLRYLNAFVEASSPTLVIWSVAGPVDPGAVVFLPPALLYFVFIILSTLRLSFRLCLFSGAVAAVEYTLLGYLYLPDTRTPLDPALASLTLHNGRGALLLLSGLIAGLVSVQLRGQVYNAVRSLEERERVVSLFGQHVSPAVVDTLLNQEVELGGEERYVCVMFLDIRDFTRFAESRRPEEVVAYLNSLFDFMVDAVNRHNGIVNKFLGDGFMAIFGAPLSDGQDSRNAVAAAREILDKIQELVAGGQIPPTRVGIGLHAGEAMTGTVGSHDRKEYTIIGDTVNVASRIEQLNKTFGTQLLVSNTVVAGLNGGGSGAVHLGATEVKGHVEPVEVFRLS
ncbi:MAG: adenylate/guanylate cyclase domain-containing protein [Chloroflexota bacterium]